MDLNREEEVFAKNRWLHRELDARKPGTPKVPRPLTRTQIEAIQANVKYLKALREQERTLGAAGSEGTDG